MNENFQLKFAQQNELHLNLIKIVDFKKYNKNCE